MKFEILVCIIFHFHTNTVLKKFTIFLVSLICKSFECKDSDIIIKPCLSNYGI